MSEHLLSQRLSRGDRYKQQQKGKNGKNSIVLKVLIVTEGTRTERGYFLPYFRKLNLPNVKCIVRDDCGSAPSNVVDHAIELAHKDQYEFIFCVFDRDSHTTYDDAKAKIIAKNKEISKSGNPKVNYDLEEVGQDFINFLNSQSKFFAITSDPCVEYWFFLHGTYSRRPIEATGKKSSGDNLVKLLKSLPEFKSYNKKLTPQQLKFLFSNTDTATKNAKRAIAEMQSVGGENPHTRIHEMLDLICKVSVLPKTK